jgi:hypothetical protein
LVGETIETEIVGGAAPAELTNAKTTARKSTRGALRAKDVGRCHAAAVGGISR